MLKKQGKKGFTLVELIVVIVILGILIAIAVPALIGYIQRAQDQGAITEAATGRTAMQSVISGSMATGTFYMNDGQAVVVGAPPLAAPPAGINAAVNELVGVDGTGYEVTALETNGSGVITSFTIKVPSGPVVEWDDTGYFVQ